MHRIIEAMGDRGSSHGNEAGRVELAHEPSFRLGSLNVHPGTLQIEQDGRRDTLEPRVMQVLVALARSNGAIVSRSQLIDLCWDGRVVGDDAVNRALSRVRHCAAGFAGGSFGVETIPRVGYRLTGKDADAPSAQVPTAAMPGPSVSRRWLFLGGAALVALGGGAALWRLPGKRVPD
jgi:DNA-binding winged helix-turn-helix (wHTH) protein